MQVSKPCQVSVFLGNGPKVLQIVIVEDACNRLLLPNCIFNWMIAKGSHFKNAFANC